MPEVEGFAKRARIYLGILRDVANKPGDSALATQIVIELVNQGHSGPEAEEILKPASRELGELAAWLLQKELGETEDQVAVVTRGCPGGNKGSISLKTGQCHRSDGVRE